MTDAPNRYSSRVTGRISQGHSQAMLYATGLSEEQLACPQVGIAAMWYDGNPCNMHLNDLSAVVRDGVNEAGLVGMRFNTIGVSDGISMGTSGMSYSLPSRDLIADSIETAMGAHFYDGFIGLPGCDKNMPGCMIAMGRLNRPSIIVYGGTIKPGCSADGEALTIVSALESYGAFLSGKIDEATRADIVRKACPGPGACGGMYTANTMASAIEAMGLSLPYSSSIPAEDPAKREECIAAGQAMKRLLEKDIKPRDIMTRAAFENAMVLITVLGGSTNAVLHLLAVARSVDVDLTLDDFQAVSDRTPFLADLKPSGKYVMEDLHEIGGTPGMLKMLLERGVIDGDILTVTGRTLGENLQELAPLAADQELIAPWDKPIKATGHLQILRGNLAPGGAVAKITGKEGQKFTGTACVFDSEEQMIEAVQQDQIGKGSVVVIRYEGPKGGPGMPEMLQPTAMIMGAGLGADVALITDGRFSGGSHGFIVGHICPEAQEGGPIALIENGDQITIDAENRRVDLHVDEKQLEKRAREWKAPPLKVQSGALYRYIKTVRPASEGCVTDV